MARDQERTRVINVKSAETNDREVINFVGTSQNVTQNDCKPDMSEISSNLSSEDWNSDLRSLKTPDSLTTVNTDDDFMFSMRDLTPSPGHLQKLMNEDLLPVIPIDVLLQTEEQTMPAPNPADMCEPNLIVAGTSKETKKKKKKNKKKNKINKKKASSVDTDVTEKKSVPDITEKAKDTEVKRTGRLEPIKEESETTHEPRVNTEEQQEAKNTSTGCFSFIRNWIAKRKEKKRMKKMAAIEARRLGSEARRSRSADNLVLNGNRTARGGVAFFVEMGNPAQPERRSRTRYTRRKNVGYDDRICTWAD